MWKGSLIVSELCGFPQLLNVLVSIPVIVSVFWHANLHSHQPCSQPQQEAVQWTLCPATHGRLIRWIIAEQLASFRTKRQVKWLIFVRWIETRLQMNANASRCMLDDMSMWCFQLLRQFSTEEVLKECINRYFSLPYFLWHQTNRGLGHKSEIS